jgi:hypothetical protein
MTSFISILHIQLSVMRYSGFIQEHRIAHAVAGNFREMTGAVGNRCETALMELIVVTLPHNADVSLTLDNKEIIKYIPKSNFCLKQSNKFKVSRLILLSCLIIYTVYICKLAVNSH